MTRIKFIYKDWRKDSSYVTPEELASLTLDEDQVMEVHWPTVPRKSEGVTITGKDGKEYRGNVRHVEWINGAAEVDIS